MNNFESFGLSETLTASLNHMGFTNPTPVQQATIPLALEGHDILGSAQTGTGKTGAFSIPMIEKIIRSDNGMALVLTPTRELAKQVLDVVHQLIGPRGNLKTAFLIGGEPMGKQLAKLKAHPRIIVGTPGRVNDHLRRKSLNLSNAGFLVLDETDRMLDMGFGVQLDEIVKYLPEERQTLMFSATLPQGIISLSKKYMKNPQRVSIGETNVIAPKIKQETVRIHQDDKYSRLITELEGREGSVIIFVKTKFGTEKMAKSLCRDGHEADALHGDLRQNKRTQVMKAFRDMKFRVLVATDIAARGLDVPHIEHVINFDLPQVAEDYIHRMGRTARAGADGAAVSFISSADNRKWREIEKLLGIEFEPEYRERKGGKFNKGKNGQSRRKNFGDKNKKWSNDNAEAGSKFDKPFKQRKPREDGQARPEKSYADKPQRDYSAKAGKPREDRKFKSDKPRADKPFSDKSRDDRKFRSDKPRADRPFSDKPRGEKTFSDKPRNEKSGDKKPFARKSSANGNTKPKSFGDKSRSRGGQGKNFRKAV